MDFHIIVETICIAGSVQVPDTYTKYNAKHKINSKENVTLFRNYADLKKQLFRGLIGVKTSVEASEKAGVAPRAGVVLLLSTAKDALFSSLSRAGRLLTYHYINQSPTSEFWEPGSTLVFTEMNRVFNEVVN